VFEHGATKQQQRCGMLFVISPVKYVAGLNKKKTWLKVEAVFATPLRLPRATSVGGSTAEHRGLERGES
jgi:hypothetical protein